MCNMVLYILRKGVLMKDAELTDVSNTESEDEVGRVLIEVTDSNVQYDTNMSIPDLIFWMKIVENMIIENVMKEQ